MAFDLSLYLVTGLVASAVKGGVSIVQLRDPLAKTRALIAQAQALQALLHGQNIPLIINDRVDVALAVGAAGVHLGQKDMDARQARALLGPQAIIGLSIGSQAEWLASQESIGAVDYIGTGPVFATGTKSDAGEAIGFAGLAAMRARTRLPMVAIGGVKTEHVDACLKAGADGVAVVSALTLAEDVEAAARGFVAAIGRARGQ